MTKKDEIIKKVVDGLREHLFREDRFPERIKIETQYDLSKSVLIINFEEEQK